MSVAAPPDLEQKDELDEDLLSKRIADVTQAHCRAELKIALDQAGASSRLVATLRVPRKSIRRGLVAPAVVAAVALAREFRLSLALLPVEPRNTGVASEAVQANVFTTIVNAKVKTGEFKANEVEVLGAPAPEAEKARAGKVRTAKNGSKPQSRDASAKSPRYRRWDEHERSWIARRQASLAGQMATLEVAELWKIAQAAYASAPGAPTMTAVRARVKLHEKECAVVLALSALHDFHNAGYNWAADAPRVELPPEQRSMLGEEFAQQLEEAAQKQLARLVRRTPLQIAEEYNERASRMPPLAAHGAEYLGRYGAAMAELRAREAELRVASGAPDDLGSDPAELKPAVPIEQVYRWVASLVGRTRAEAMREQVSGLCSRLDAVKKPLEADRGRGPTRAPGSPKLPGFEKLSSKSLLAMRHALDKSLEKLDPEAVAAAAKAERAYRPIAGAEHGEEAAAKKAARKQLGIIRRALDSGQHPDCWTDRLARKLAVEACLQARWEKHQARVRARCAISTSVEPAEVGSRKLTAGAREMDCVGAREMD
jgi:hypothetical protein